MTAREWFLRCYRQMDSKIRRAGVSNFSTIRRFDMFLIWSELSIPLFIGAVDFDVGLHGLFCLSKVERVAIELAFATVDQSDIRGSKPHNRDPSGAASH